MKGETNILWSVNDILFQRIFVSLPKRKHNIITIICVIHLILDLVV